MLAYFVGKTIVIDSLICSNFYHFVWLCSKEFLTFSFMNIAVLKYLPFFLKQKVQVGKINLLFVLFDSGVSNMLDNIYCLLCALECVYICIYISVYISRKAITEK